MDMGSGHAPRSGRVRGGASRRRYRRVYVPACAAVVPGRTTWRIGQRFAWLFLRMCAIPLAVRGLENLPRDGPYVVASNHTSYLDGAVLLAILPWHKNAFVAKRELRDSFITRIFLGGLGRRQKNSSPDNKIDCQNNRQKPVH